MCYSWRPAWHGGIKSDAGAVDTLLLQRGAFDKSTRGVHKFAAGHSSLSFQCVVDEVLQQNLTAELWHSVVATVSWQGVLR